MIPNKFNIETYDYKLPKELIAQEPYQNRDEARLLIVKNNNLIDDTFKNLLNYLNPSDVIVINKTKVLKFKLDAHKLTGAKAEITVMNTNLQDPSNTLIKCKIKGSRPRTNDVYEFENSQMIAKIINLNHEDFYLEFYDNKNTKNKLNILEIKKYCDKFGSYPLPGYIKNQKKDKDYQEKYQAIFANNEGSIAAPTASLHFSNKLIETLKQKGIKFAELTLHVSYSTFKPITSSDIRKHEIDPEFITIDKENAKIINDAKGKVVAIGTTVLKSLESISNNNGFIEATSMWSDLFIYPSYKFKSKATHLITNFHLPKSSLVLLTSAFGSWNIIKKAYEHAACKQYKFFSFGDAMMLEKYN